MKNFLKEFISACFLISSDFALFYLFFWMFGLGIKYISIPLMTLIFNSCYSTRYDFWQETKVIQKSFVFAFLINIFILHEHILSLFFVYFSLCFVIPISKFILKRILFHVGIWKKGIIFLTKDKNLRFNILKNHYIGYVKATDKNATILNDLSDFNDLNDFNDFNDLNDLNRLINLKENFNLSQLKIFTIFNSQNNLIFHNNNLTNKNNLLLKNFIEFCIFICVFIPSIIVICVIFIIMKLAEPNESVFFTQIRFGKNGKVFKCFKFRTMITNQEILKTYLQNNPKEKAYYEKYHKLKNDPRVTKLGNFLRKYSLDELPQIFNVLKLEMNFIGPRPYMISEKHKIKPNLKLILSVKPGITGLWQVTSRNEKDFFHRIKTDVWYIKNWSIYNDLIILAKTFKAVVFKHGAY